MYANHFGPHFAMAGAKQELSRYIRVREVKLIPEVVLLSVRGVRKPGIAPGEVVLEYSIALRCAKAGLVDTSHQSVQCVQETDDAVGCPVDKGPSVQGLETIIREPQPLIPGNRYALQLIP